MGVVRLLDVAGSIVLLVPNPIDLRSCDSGSRVELAELLVQGYVCVV